MAEIEACPNCGASQLVDVFHQVDVPVHSVVLLKSRQEALDIARGEIRLALCQGCSFGFNRAFDVSLIDYFQEYESTQAYSVTFNKFHHHLADDLVAKFRLDGKDVIEIGCGQGEFLTLLAEKCELRGIGFDPAYYGDGEDQSDQLSFIKDYYSEKYGSRTADFIICKMTLEHISRTREFIRNIRTALAGNLHSKVFFQIPNASRIYHKLAFWDVYYEHCSYFNKQSLVTLFELNHFKVDDCYVDYDDQYLMIEAQAVEPESESLSFLSQNNIDSRAEVEFFSTQVPQRIEDWRNNITTMAQQGGKPVLWGGGSKAVAFLTALNHPLQLEYAVDINPKKSNTYLPGGGQKVVAPEALKSIQPSHVIIMNGIYRDEISAQIAEMGLSPIISTLDD